MDYYDDEDEIEYVDRVPNLSHKDKMDEVTAALQQIVPNELFLVQNEAQRCFAHMNDIRKEGTFCDVTFVVKSSEFRAHKVVVSGWSRWLHGILAEAPDDDIVTLDVFDIAAFSMVLDYMYGQPISFTLNDADNLLKVIRRLEMEELEQHCWAYCLKVVSKENCSDLHELADKYSCAPLKLAAWRTLQQSAPGYAANPERTLLVSGADMVGSGHGFTGPGEKLIKNLEDSGFKKQDKSNTDERKSRFGTFDFDDEDEDEDGEDRENNSPSKQFYDSPKNRKTRISVLAHHHPEEAKQITPLNELVANAEASAIVAAWSVRLQEVYERCVPDQERAGDVYGETYDDINWYDELRHIYLVLNMPQKVDQIPQILATWVGKEDKMLRSFIFKYRSSLPPQSLTHLQSLADRLEMHRQMTRDPRFEDYDQEY